MRSIPAHHLFLFLNSKIFYDIIKISRLPTVFTRRHVFENFLIFLNDMFRFKEQNGYLQLNVKLGDKFDIMCPKVKSFAETINPTEPLFLALWNVNRRGFNSCTVDKRTSKRLVRCNVPDYEKKYTMRVQVSFFLILNSNLIFD